MKKYIAIRDGDVHVLELEQEGSGQVLSSYDEFAEVPDKGNLVTVGAGFIQASDNSDTLYTSTAMISTEEDLPQDEGKPPVTRKNIRLVASIGRHLSELESEGALLRAIMEDPDRPKVDAIVTLPISKDYFDPAFKKESEVKSSSDSLAP